MDKKYVALTNDEFNQIAANREAFVDVDTAVKSFVEGNNGELPESGLIVIQRAAEVRPKKPRAVAKPYVVESARKTGPRKKKDSSVEATETTASE